MNALCASDLSGLCPDDNFYLLEDDCSAAASSSGERFRPRLVSVDGNGQSWIAEQRSGPNSTDGMDVVASLRMQ